MKWMDSRKPELEVGPSISEPGNDIHYINVIRDFIIILDGHALLNIAEISKELLPIDLMDQKYLCGHAPIINSA